MIFTKTALAGVVLVEPEPREDERGFFARVWCEREFAAHGLPTRWVQCSLSFNRLAGTLRGMHYQRTPYEEAKLVRCTSGAIYDVAIDLRQGSSGFKRHVGMILSALNHKMVFIPEGFAHGFLTLEHDTEVFYNMSEFHAPAYAAGVRWNDPAFGIEWPPGDYIMSDQDRSYPDFVA